MKSKTIMSNPFLPSACPQPDAGETLITRSITFRNSTFGGLKSFIREYAHKTGKQLTNAAAVDLLIREQLMESLNRNAVSAMWELSTATASAALDRIADKEADDIDHSRTRDGKISLAAPPRGRSSVIAFNCEVRKSRRAPVTNSEGEQA